MPRRLRVAGGGYVYHVLNRAVGRMRIFARQRDFEAFEEVIAQAKERLPMRILAWCVMPNHWHFALWPRGDGDLSEFMRWLTVTHTQRPRRRGRPVGPGPATAAPTLAAARADAADGSGTGVAAPLGESRRAVRRGLVAAAHREAIEPPIHPTPPRPPPVVARQVPIPLFFPPEHSQAGLRGQASPPRPE